MIGKRCTRMHLMRCPFACRMGGKVYGSGDDMPERFEHPIRQVGRRIGQRGFPPRLLDVLFVLFRRFLHGTVNASPSAVFCAWGCRIASPEGRVPAVRLPFAVARLPASAWRRCGPSAPDTRGTSRSVVGFRPMGKRTLSVL